MSRTHSRLMIFGMVCAVPVLLCLIGVGVLLYVVADESSAEVAELVQRQQTASQLQEKCEALRRQIAELEEKLRQLDRRLAEAQKAKDLQAQLAQLEQEKRRLQQELEKLQKQWQELQNRTQANTQEQKKLEQQLAEAQWRLARLEQKIREMQPGPGQPQDPGPTLAELQAAKRALQQQIEQQNRLNEQKQARRDELAEKQKDPSKRFRIEEVSGSQGWKMPPNPLYVECDGQGILLQPEKRRLSASPNTSQEEDFLQTVRAHKYVLFLIRPNGFDSFRTYRKLLRQKAEEVDYGYEPIAQDSEVLYPERS